MDRLFHFLLIMDAISLAIIAAAALGLRLGRQRPSGPPSESR